MTVRQRTCFVWLPILSVFAYFVAILYFPDGKSSQFLSEVGPIEVGTALCFILAAGVSVNHVRQHGDQLLPIQRAFFWLFAFVVLFVGLEELSYGQHLLGYQSPNWFAQNNHQAETNLHNLMGNKPSRLIRSFASFSVPMFFVFLPWTHRRREYWRRDGHWSHAILPDPRLAMLVIIAQAVTFPRRLPESIVPYAVVDRVGELKELYWGIAALGYAGLMLQRAKRIEQSAAMPVAGTILAAAPSPTAHRARWAA